MKLLLVTFLSLIFSVTIYGQEWEYVSPVLDDFKTDHSIGFSLDGKGYIVTGATSEGKLSSAMYEYDPNDDTWTQKESHPGGERGFAIGDTYDGKFYMGFGVNNIDVLNDLWVYDGETWKELAPCACKGRLHPAFTISNGIIYMGLGNNSDGDLNDWWEYNIDTDTWRQLPDLPGEVRHHPYQFSIGDYVYAGLGHGDDILNDWYRYDPVTEQWTEATSLPSQGRVAGAQFEHEKFGYVLSGEGEDHRTMLTGEFWKYDPELDFWDELVPHPGNSRWAPATFIIEDYLYLINGAIRGTSYEYPSDNYRYFIGDNVSSVGDELESTMIKLYPNPASKYIYLELLEELESEISTVSIADVNGRIIRNMTGKIDHVDISFLAQGQYNLILNIGDKSLTERFVKK